MKNKIILIITFLILFAFGASSVNAENNQEIVVGLDINVPPMGFLDSNGNITGFDIDLAKETFKVLGKEITFQPIDWDSKELELSTGKIDVIWNGLSYTPERAKNMLLTKTYMQNNQVFIVKKGSGISDISDLNQKTVCVQKGSSGETALKNSDVGKNFKNITTLENMVNCLSEVRFLKTDTTLADEVTARYYLAKNNLESEFEILSDPLSTENYVVAVKNGNETLKNEIEYGLTKIIENGVAENISKKWFGKNIICFENAEQTSSNSKNKNDSFQTQLLGGLLETLKLFIVCFILSFPIGIILAFLRKFGPLKFLIDIYTNIMRSTPLLLQIFFMFYGLPIMFPNLKITDRFLIGVTSFVLNYAAYFTEISRGGLKSIDKNQLEAIKVLQIPKFTAIFKIILPQMFKVCLPSVCNETVSLVKDTALIFSIGIVELLTSAKSIVNETANITAYIATFLIYLAICTTINLIFKWVENKLKFE